MSEVQINIHQFTNKVGTFQYFKYNRNIEVNNDLNLQKKSTKSNQFKYYQNVR